MPGSGITVYRGDSKDLRIDVVRADKTPYDLTDMRLVMTVKSDPDADDVMVQVEAEVTEPGVAMFHLAPSDTEHDPGQYFFDIELSNQDRSFVLTLVSSRFTVLRDITRRVL